MFRVLQPVFGDKTGLGIGLMLGFLNLVLSSLCMFASCLVGWDGVRYYTPCTSSVRSMLSWGEGGSWVLYVTLWLICPFGLGWCGILSSKYCHYCCCYS